MDALDTFTQAAQGSDIKISCLNMRQLRDMKLDMKNTLIFSLDDDLDIISTFNTQNNKRIHNTYPTEACIKHETGFVTCTGIHHGNIKLGNKTFYNTFFEIPFKIPTILGQKTASIFLSLLV